MRLLETADAAPASQEQDESAIEIIAGIRHPHLVVMQRQGDQFEADLGGGRLFSDLLEAHGWRLPLRISIRILLDAMSGLAALHGARRDGVLLGFVHGEVAPQHIVVGRDGVARLIPLLRAPDAPASLETGYSAPEKLLGDDFSQRADVFSIGVLLWEAIEGKALFRNQSIDEVVTFLVGGKVSRPNVSKGDPWSAELAEVVVRALAVDPADRWENVGFMGADIETIAEGHMAKSYEVATLVTGRDVTRDSLSDELTTRISTAASLTPFANSIPSPNDGDAVPDSRSGTRGASTEPVVTSAVETGTARRPMPRRRARMIVTGALSLGALLLTIAGLKALTHATVSTSSANGIGSPAAAPFPEPARPEPIPVADPAAPAAAPNGLPEAEPTAPVASSGVHTAPAVPAQGKAARVLPRSSAPGKTGKPKDDPFGLLKPAKPKKDDDPFGL